MCHLEGKSHLEFHWSIYIRPRFFARVRNMEKMDMEVNNGKNKLLCSLKMRDCGLRTVLH
jgi:hypothetical protein